jgi:hypothetical protein
MRVLLALLPLLILVSCAPDTEASLHEVNLFGAEYARISYFYGLPGELDLGGSTVTLERASGRSTEPLAVGEALRVEDRPYLLEPLMALRQAPSEVARVPGTSDLRVRVGQDSAQIVYFDGEAWFTLLEDARAGTNVRVVPRQRFSALQGLGELTRSEAVALARHLEKGGPVVVTVLDEIPSTARAVVGLAEYLRTGLYLQRPIGTLEATARTAGSDLVFEVLASGSQAAGVDEAQWRVITDAEALRSTWNQVHGTLLSVPATPRVDFSRDSVLALLLGSRPTGGYGVNVVSMSLENGEAFADVRFTEPAADAFTTQAITSPWQLVRVLRPGLQAVWLRDADTGRIIGVARPAGS